MTPNARLNAMLADLRATLDLERAERLTDPVGRTRLVKDAQERKRATTHALMALELREKREAAQ